MRILVLSSDYPPTQGGIARLSWQTTVALSRHHEVRVVAGTSDFVAARAFDQQQPCSTRRVSASLGLRELSMARALWQETRSFQPDVIWSALWFPEAVLASYLVSPSRALRTFSAYAAEFIPSTATWRKQVKNVLRPLLDHVLQESDRIFALSSYSRAHLLRLGAPESHIQTVPGGVSEDWFQVQPDATRSGLTLLTVARLDANKGHDTMIRALPAVRAVYPDIRYVIIGPRTPYLEVLRELSRSLGVGDAVEYRGTVSDAELKQAYREADLFVMLSRETEGYVEGFGLTFLEAAAAWLPSVAGRSGGVPDAVEDGVSGLLVEPESPHEVAAAVLRLLGDEELRHRMGAQGRERAWRHFRWETIASTLTRAFEELSAGRRR